MDSPVVTDTTVAVVANQVADHAGAACVRVCIERLERTRETGVLVIDDAGSILREYDRILDRSGGPRVGDAFGRRAWRHRYDERRCERVAGAPDDDRGFSDFTDSEDLWGFDRDDRVFVAVALASDAKPAILNATDTDWWDYPEALGRHGVEIEFLCPELMSDAKPPRRGRRGLPE